MSCTCPQNRGPGRLVLKKFFAKAFHCVDSLQQWPIKTTKHPLYACCGDVQDLEQRQILSYDVEPMTVELSATDVECCEAAQFGECHHHTELGAGERRAGNIQHPQVAQGPVTQATYEVVDRHATQARSLKLCQLVRPQHT